MKRIYNKSLFTVCQKRLGLSEDDERPGWSRSVFGCANEAVVPVVQRPKRAPVESRVDAFTEVLSVADRGSEDA